MRNKNIIRLNENDNYLSLGNLFRIIKAISINPNSYLQSDLFCIIFNCEKIGSSTVNNYCTGVRSINPEYKNYLLNIKSKYQNDNSVLIPTISKILTLIDTGKFTSEIYDIEKINNSDKIKCICSKLYTISKNDLDVKFEFSNKLQNYIKKGDYYDFIVEVLFYVVLEKIQPLYKKTILIDTIEKNLTNTNISVSNIEKFMQLQLNSGIWSIRGLSELAKEKNPFACFEMASLEFYGIVSGVKRYNKAFEYYKVASDNNHPVAHWAIGYLYYNGYIGNKTEDDMKLAYDYFIKSSNLNCSSAFNSLGLVYLNGDIPNIEKDELTAKSLFEQSANLGNVYAYNNLGKLEEKNKNYKKAFEYYETSANLGDSWALNKIGEFYRLGIYVEKNLSIAFEYYQKSSECSILSLCYWSKYNLAKYYYKNGIPEINIYKNTNKAIELLESISNNLMEANEELIYIYYNLYVNNSKEDKYLNKLKYYINILEQNNKCNNTIKSKIEKEISNIKNQSINIEKFL